MNLMTSHAIWLQEYATRVGLLVAIKLGKVLRLVWFRKPHTVLWIEWQMPMHVPLQVVLPLKKFWKWGLKLVKWATRSIYFRNEASSHYESELGWILCVRLTEHYSVEG